MYTPVRALRRAVRAATPVLALGTAGLTAALAACADTPTSPAASSSESARQPSTTTATVTGTASPSQPASAVVSQTVKGDTVVTVFTLGTSTSNRDMFDLQNGSRLEVFGGAGAVCDPATSSYGPGTWDSACTPATQPVTITAKAYVDRSTGQPRADFEPALRFVPSHSATVQIYLHDPTYVAGRDGIWYCPTTAGSACVNESATDPTLRIWANKNSQWIYRPIKHFSGYTISY